MTLAGIFEITPVRTPIYGKASEEKSISDCSLVSTWRALGPAMLIPQ